MKDYSPLISIEEFIKIKDDENVILFDASNGKDSKTRYQTEHIHGAIHIDLETELSSVEKNAANGGRHPLPQPKDFSATLSKKGLTPQHHVVIYDDNNGGIAAARFWWMLKAIGHLKVQVLNGGYEWAKEKGLKISSFVRKFEETSYPLSDWKLPIINYEDVLKATKNSSSVIIDVRAESRYKGDNEPIDKVAGHIPSAKNLYYFRNMQEDGFFKSKEELYRQYKGLVENKEDVIVHCGSGVTACHTILSMVLAGFPYPKLYVGSWSEWSRR